jgi:hypothetical protein
MCSIFAKYRGPPADDRFGATLAVLIIFSGLQAVAEADKVFIPELRKLRVSVYQ